MPVTSCLNVRRHAELVFSRNEETYERFIDPVWRHVTSDDIDVQRARPQVAAAAGRLLLDQGRLLVIRHSATVSVQPQVHSS